MQRRDMAKGVVLGLALVLGSAGCGAELVAAQPSLYLYGYSVTGVATVPYNIYSYPSAYWNGANAYWVDGYWYYPTTSGWVVLLEEPRYLNRYRSSWAGVQSAPSARPRPPQVDYGYPGYPIDRRPASPEVQTAPPSSRGRPPVQMAPPRR